MKKTTVKNLLIIWLIVTSFILGFSWGKYLTFRKVNEILDLIEYKVNK